MNTIRLFNNISFSRQRIPTRDTLLGLTSSSESTFPDSNDGYMQNINGELDYVVRVPLTYGECDGMDLVNLTVGGLSVWGWVSQIIYNTPTATIIHFEPDHILTVLDNYGNFTIGGLTDRATLTTTEGVDSYRLMTPEHITISDVTRPRHNVHQQIMNAFTSFAPREPQATYLVLSERVLEFFGHENNFLNNALSESDFVEEIREIEDLRYENQYAGRSGTSGGNFLGEQIPGRPIRVSSLNSMHAIIGRISRSGWRIVEDDGDNITGVNLRDETIAGISSNLPPNTPDTLRISIYEVQIQIINVEAQLETALALGAEESVISDLRSRLDQLESILQSLLETVPEEMEREIEDANRLVRYVLFDESDIISAFNLPGNISNTFNGVVQIPAYQGDIFTLDFPNTGSSIHGLGDNVISKLSLYPYNYYTINNRMGDVLPIIPQTHFVRNAGEVWQATYQLQCRFVLYGGVNPRIVMRVIPWGAVNIEQSDEEILVCEMPKIAISFDGHAHTLNASNLARQISYRAAAATTPTPTSVIKRRSIVNGVLAAVGTMAIGIATKGKSLVAQSLMRTAGRAGAAGLAAGMTTGLTTRLQDQNAMDTLQRDFPYNTSNVYSSGSSTLTVQGTHVWLDYLINQIDPISIYQRGASNYQVAETEALCRVRGEIINVRATLTVGTHAISFVTPGISWVDHGHARYIQYAEVSEISANVPHHYHNYIMTALEEGLWML